MRQAFDSGAVRAAEQPLLTAERGFAGGLMHRAATALALAVVAELRDLRGRVVGGSVVALVGSGNNGGDALHALAVLAGRGVSVTAVLTARSVHEGGLRALGAAGGRVVTVVHEPDGDGGDDGGAGAEGRDRPDRADHPGAAAERLWWGDALAEAFAADIVLDGLLGIGARGPLRGTAAELVALLEDLCRTADEAGPVRGTRPVVVAVDVPSGVGVDDGALGGPVLHADRTVTFGALKPALLLPPACRAAGRVDVVDLGLSADLADHHEPTVLGLDARDVALLWPRPPADGHKYSRGVVGVLAGSPAYPGAAVLTVAGAQGTGCGMVRFVGPEAVAAAVVAAHPEVVAGQSVDVRVQAWVLGPGVPADDDEQRARIEQVLAAAVVDGTPVVVDAGALDLLPERVGAQVVLTPHAGELARLVVARGQDVTREAVETAPLRWARRAHDLTGATVLLKGPTTLVVGTRVHAQAQAPAWLATAGAGDVLAGVLGSLLAGRARDLPDDPDLVGHLAAVAADVHGRAAHRANPGGPVTAGDVARALPATVADLLR